MAKSWKDLAKEAQEKSIVLAATRLFGRKGFSATKMEEIAEEAGISKATLYKLFPSKEDLFINVVESLHEEFHIKTNVLKEDKFPLLFESFLERIFSFLEEKKGLIRILFFDAPALGERRKRLFSSIREHREIYLGLLKRILRAGEKQGIIEDDIEFLSLTLLSLLKGVFQESLFIEEDRTSEFFEYAKEKAKKIITLKEVKND